MTVIIASIAFLGMVALLILVHELGHLLSAKYLGVKVEEFAFGFPPRLLAVRWRETLFSLNLLPLGGFVKMAGEQDPDIPGGLAGKSAGVRLLILSAGSVLMLLLPFFLLPVSYMIPQEHVVGGEGVQIVQVSPGSPAEKAGLTPGDVLLRAGGQTIHSFEDLREAVDARLGAELRLVLLRGGKEIEAALVPQPNPPRGQGALGIQIRWANLITERTAYLPWKAIPIGLRHAWGMLVLIKEGIQELVQGEGTLQPLGPVGIAQLTGEVSKEGLMPLVGLASLLSINLGIINLLPIPALDGGRIVFVLIELLQCGRRISPKREALIHSIGLAVLIALIVLVTSIDIVRLVNGESLLP